MKYDIQKLFNCHSVFTGLSGKLGNYVFYMRNDRICARIYLVPANPRTARQQARRLKFAEAVRYWRGLDDTDRAAWNVRARKKRRTGYNLFIGEWMRRVEAVHSDEVRSKKPELAIIHEVRATRTTRKHLSPRPIARVWQGPHRVRTRRTRAPAEIRAA